MAVYIIQYMGENVNNIVWSVLQVVDFTEELNFICTCIAEHGGWHTGSSVICHLPAQETRIHGAPPCLPFFKYLLFDVKLRGYLQCQSPVGKGYFTPHLGHWYIAVSGLVYRTACRYFIRIGSPRSSLHPRTKVLVSEYGSSLLRSGFSIFSMPIHARPGHTYSLIGSILLGMRTVFVIGCAFLMDKFLVMLKICYKLLNYAY